MWTNDHSTEAIWKVGFTINSYGGRLGTIFANYDYTTLRPVMFLQSGLSIYTDANDLRAFHFLPVFHYRITATDLPGRY